MKSKKIKLVLILWIFTASATAAVGKSFHVPDLATVDVAGPSTLNISRDSIVVVQNDPDPDESKNKPAEDTENRASGTGEEITEDRRKNAEENRAEPLKPFVPSEEIDAEQAVDFPSDI